MPEATALLCESMAGIKPAVVGMTPFVAFAQGDHLASSFKISEYCLSYDKLKFIVIKQNHFESLFQ